MQDNLDFYNEKYTYGKHYPQGESNPFGYIPSMYRDPLISAFGEDIFTTVIAHLNHLGFTDAFPLRQWKTRFTIDRMTHPDYCWKFASIWSIKIGLFAHCPETYFQSYDDIYLATLHENFEPHLAEQLYHLPCDTHDMETVLNMEPDQLYGYVLPHSAVTCLQPALASAVDVGYTNAEEAWDKYITRGGQADYVAEAYHNNNIVPMTTQASAQTYTRIIVDNADHGFSTTGYWSDSMTPVVLNFSPQVPETPGPYQHVQIENTGTCALNAKDITLIGNNFEMINHCPTLLASGEICEISIRSLPVDAYAILEYLRIEQDAFSYQIPVTGYGDIPVEPPVISVGSGKDYQTIAEALSHSDHGTIIEIDAGTYLEDVSTVAFDDLTIRGVGGRAHLNANDHAAEDKAIFVVKGNNTIFENIEFSNCRVKDKNGAGIRHEGLKLTLFSAFLF